MVDTIIDKASIKELVREELGCTCPDEVFATIYIKRNPAEFNDVLKGDLLEIGGRLLVYLIQTDDVDSVVSNMKQIFIQGQEMRNAGRFNRFRLVVAVPAVQPVEKLLWHEFESLKGLDEKLHLHVIGIDQLPKSDQKMCSLNKIQMVPVEQD